MVAVRRPSCERRKLEELAARCQKVAEQIDRRVRGLKITDRLVSITDPDARPIRKGKLGKPTEFGYVAQICEVTENTRKGARGFILPAAHARATRPRTGCSRRPPPSSTAPGSDPREIVADGGFHARPDQRRVPRPRRRADPALRASRTRLPTNPQTQSPLPNRHRGPHQPPQTRLRHSAAPGSKATTGCRSGQAGRSSPTTSTPSPSEPTETLHRPPPPGNQS